MAELLVMLFLIISQRKAQTHTTTHMHPKTSQQREPNILKVMEKFTEETQFSLNHEVSMKQHRNGLEQRKEMQKLSLRRFKNSVGLMKKQKLKSTSTLTNLKVRYSTLRLV